MAFLAIVLLCVAGAVVYGVLQDLVTAHVCLEYFSVFHGTPDGGPVAQALHWGVVATWWVGLALGVLLALAARRGPGPRRGWRDLLRPVAMLLVGVGAVALLAGLLGAWLAAQGAVVVAPPWDARIPRERHVAFLADLWAHNAAYLAGAVGGLVLAWRVQRGRRRPAAGAPSGARGA